MPCVSVVVSSDFCCFKLALPSLLSMSKDEVDNMDNSDGKASLKHLFGTMNKKCERAPSNKYVCHARLCLQFQTTFKLINSSLKT